MKTTHDLPFEACESPYDIFGDGHMLFRVGTCEGQYGATPDSYYIISVINKQPGNGHFTDVLEWFYHSCKRDNRNLIVLECMNKKFFDHLVIKRGFVALGKDKENCIKIFNRKYYKRLLKNGNEILLKGSLKCI